MPTELEMVDVRVAGEITICRRGVSDVFEAAIDDALSGWVKVRRGKRTEQERVSLLRREDGRLVIPRGAVRQLNAAARSVGVSLRWASNVVAVPGCAVPFDDLGVSLRPYQRDGVDALLDRVQCLLRLPCGGGKTTIGAAALVRSGASAIVLAPTIDIVEQWRVTLERMGVGRVVTKWRPLAPGEVRIAIPSALRGLGDEDAAIRSAGVLVVDECHRAPADSWASVVARCPARFRWGLTATLDRADGLAWALPLLFGPVVEPATAEELIGAGWLVQPLVVPVLTGWAPPDRLRPAIAICSACGVERSIDPALDEAPCPRRGRPRCPGVLRPTGERDPILWGPAMAELARSEERTRLVMEFVEAAIATGRTVLALVPTVEAANRIADALVMRRVNVEALSGQDSRGRRRDVLAKLRDGRIAGLVSTRLADEGLDVPSLDLVVLAEPGRSKGRALQRAGRSMRPGGVRPIVLDLVDDGPEFESQWYARSRGYVAELGASCLASRAPMSHQRAMDLLRGTTGAG